VSVIVESSERRLVRHGQATFRRFVEACNRRDTYRLELNDAARPLSAKRHMMLGQRVVVLDHEIAHYEAELTDTERRLRAMDP
jgi:hypothetical protein